MRPSVAGANDHRELEVSHGDPVQPLASVFAAAELVLLAATVEHPTDLERRVRTGSEALERQPRLPETTRVSKRQRMDQRDITAIGRKSDGCLSGFKRKLAITQRTVTARLPERSLRAFRRLAVGGERVSVPRERLVALRAIDVVQRNGRLRRPPAAATCRGALDDLGGSIAERSEVGMSASDRAPISESSQPQPTNRSSLPPIASSASRSMLKNAPTTIAGRSYRAPLAIRTRLPQPSSRR